MLTPFYDKMELYARFGVKEDWIGDPANKALEVLTLKEGRYELHGCADEKGKLASLVLAGWSSTCRRSHSPVGGSLLLGSHLGFVFLWVRRLLSPNRAGPRARRASGR